MNEQKYNGKRKEKRKEKKKTKKATTLGEQKIDLKFYTTCEHNKKKKGKERI